MKIKNPVLVYKTVEAVYELDIEGTKVRVKYTYDVGDEQMGGWSYNLSPCYVGLNEDEIAELDNEVADILCEIAEEYK